MDVLTLFGLDVSGVDAITLCTLVAVGLAGLIVGGFVLLCRTARDAHRLAGITPEGQQDLGLPALWRLGRALQHGSTPASENEPSQAGRIP
ncbi:MAG: hypothetical protein HY675_05070 [Chloroflexi bacterium]|nr:hypothetical protein [Chloroflexota bacterium]